MDQAVAAAGQGFQDGGRARVRGEIIDGEIETEGGGADEEEQAGDHGVMLGGYWGAMMLERNQGLGDGSKR